MGKAPWVRATRRRPLSVPAGLLALACASWLFGGSAAGAAALSPALARDPAPGPAGGASWTVYHQNPAGTGVAQPVASVNTSARAWTSPSLDGEIYGEPLVYAGQVYVATENDTVYALNARTGALAWSTHLGTPVPSSSLPCGDITPTVGITGTPVIDPSRNEIFVVADEMVNGTPAHTLTGLAIASGHPEMTRDVDPAGADTAALLQRTGLTLDDGRVVFGMGGNFGDCASYRGRIIAAPETGGKPLTFTVDAAAGEFQGAVWMGGAAPVVDSSGHVWVSVGNGSVYSSSHAYDDSDSVLELSPTMRLLQYFAPSDWATNNSQDLDMSTAPVLLPDGQVILTGKSAIVYLLDGAHLGGIGHQQATLTSACPQDIDGGIGLIGMTVYLPCRTGIIAVRATQSPPALHLLWSSGTGGGPAIVAAGLVWTIGQDGMLYGLDPATGKVRQQAPIGALANHFPTPSVADGLMLAPAADDVVAFTVSSSGAPPATSPATTAPVPTSRATAAPAQAASGGLGAGAVAGITAGGVVLIGAAGAAVWILWRRRNIGHN
jgi:outer membrane protein assembly factor BamB